MKKIIVFVLCLVMLIPAIAITSNLDYADAAPAYLDGEYSDFKFVAETDTLVLYLNETNLNIAVVNKETDYIWSTMVTVEEYPELETASDRRKLRLSPLFNISVASTVGFSTTISLKAVLETDPCNFDIDYTLERQQLVDERNRIEAQISSNSSAVYASSSGYFYGDVDGYEEIFSPDVIDTLTLKSFEEISNKEPDEGILSSGAVKVINDFVWYLVCEAPSDRAASLVTGRSYDIVFPESGDETISMRLVNVVSETTASEALAIFRANVMPASFDYKRGQRAEIVMDVVEGLSVPKKALRSVDGENGVYVRVGDVIHYRSVEIVDEVDNYYIVSFGKKAQYFEEDGEEGDDNINKKEPSKPLGLYDNIVVSGKDLFDGKIVG